VFSIGPSRHVVGDTHPLDGEQSFGVGVGQHIHIVTPLFSGCCSPCGVPQFSLLHGDMHPSTCPLLIMRKSTDFSDTACPFVITLLKLPFPVKSSPVGHFAKSNVDASTPLKPQLGPLQSHPDVSPTGVSLYGIVHPSTWEVSNHVVGFCSLQSLPGLHPHVASKRLSTGGVHPPAGQPPGGLGQYCIWSPIKQFCPFASHPYLAQNLDPASPVSGTV